MQHINKHKLVNRLRSIAGHGLFKFGFVAVGVVATFGIATKVLPKVSPTWASPGPQLAPIYLSEFGSAGTDVGQFAYDIGGMATDSQNNIFVTDSGNNRIEKFDSNGANAAVFGNTSGLSPASLSSPSGIAIDSTGNVYVTDKNNNRIIKFDSNGANAAVFGNTSGLSPASLSSPSGIAIDSTGSVYVADVNNDRIVKFDNQGNNANAFGSFGSDHGQFNMILGLAVDSQDNLYVADNLNNRVQKFDSNFTYETQFGEFGTGVGQLNGVWGVAVDNNDDIYVGDIAGSRIEKFGYVHDKSLTTPSTDGVAEQGKAVELSTPSANILEADTKSEFDSSLVKDPLNSYPLGLVHYKLDVVDGVAKTDVTISFATSLSPTDVKLRQYDPVNHTFSDISNVAKDSTTVDGEPGIKFTYINSVGSTPGIIENTVGVAKANTTTMDLDSPTDNIYSTTPTPFTLDATNGGANDVNIIPSGTTTISEFDPNLTSGKDPMNIYPYGLVKLKLDVIKGAIVDIKLTGLDTTGLQLISYTGSTNTTTSTANGSNSISLPDTDHDGIIEAIIGLAKPNTTTEDLQSATDNVYSINSTSFTFNATNGSSNDANIVSATPVSEFAVDDGVTQNPANKDPLNIYPYGLVKFKLDVAKGASVILELDGLDTSDKTLKSYTNGTYSDEYTGATSVTLTDTDNDGFIDGTIGLAKPNTTNKDFAGGITMTVPDTSNIADQCSDVQTITMSGPSPTTPNAKYLYPLRLLSYCLDVMPSATQQVTITWQTSLRPDQVQPQKYDPNTDDYDNLDKDDYSLTQVQQDGSNALQLTYDVTDNGSLDADTDSGFIVDPITLAHPTTPAQQGGSGSGGGGGTGDSGNGSGNGGNTNKPNVKTPTVKLSSTLSSNGGKGGATPGAYRADGSLVPGAPDTGGGILSNLMNANLTSVMLAGTITMLMAGSLLVMGKVNKQ